MFIPLHRHTHYSNSNIAEVISFPEQYINQDVARERKAACFTEHGTILSWVNKKKFANEAGLKYIHGVEAYITDDYSKKIRDNNHLVLLAKNYEGVKEINRLTSISFQGKGDKTSTCNHFYYSPRISFEEVINTSDNVLILTACLGSPIYQAYKHSDEDKFNRWLDFITKNKHRVWLEVQAHDHPEQKIYNRILLQIAEKYDMNIVATNDVHAHDKESDIIRKQLMKASGIYFEDDDENEFELWDKDYNELFDTFKKQGVLTDEQITKALDETVKIADMVEDFEFDVSHKYPSIFEDEDHQIKTRILEGYKFRGIDKLPEKEQLVYRKRVAKELDAYKKTGSIPYILLEDYVKGEMRKEGRHAGYGRGSATGSIITFLLQITEVDPIKEGLSFERFINIHRVSLADIDSDWYADDRNRVQEFLLSHPNLECNAIVTYNTYGYKLALKTMGKFYGIDKDELQRMADSIEEEVPESLREKYPELLNVCDKLVGVISSVGRHAAGVIVADKSHNLASELGSIEVKDFPFPVSAVAMKEVDSLNYVKLDVLGLDNIGLISKTCELAGLPFATPQSDFIDFQDEKVWRSMADSNVAIFQFEGSDRAGKILKEVYSERTLNNIKKELGDDIKYLDLLSLANAAQRPSGASFIEDIMEGKFTSNGHKALDNMLKDTLGNLTYQEQQIKFLTDFCGYTESKADLIRRAIGKKNPQVIKEEVPKIREAFIKTMQTEHGDSKEHAEQIADNFMQVFLDAANYSFSKNHSVPYSYIGYISAWLRYYYPLEFLTAGMEIWQHKMDKTNKLIDYANKLGIQIKPPKFRFSKGSYFMSKSENAIYQGTAPIKSNNAITGDLLYDKFIDRQYDYFTDFLIDLKDRRTFIIDGVEHEILDIFKNNDINAIKELDAIIKNGQAKQTWSVYSDKTLLNSFNRWLDKPEQIDIKMQIDDLILQGTEDYMSVDWVRKEFDNWRFNIFTGKKRWEDIENAKDVEIKFEDIPVDKGKILPLIELNFFEEFGGNAKLYKVAEKFYKIYNSKNKTLKGKFEKYQELIKYEKSLKDESMSTLDQCAIELFYTGRVNVTNKEIPKEYVFVTEILKVSKTVITANVYSIQTGKYFKVKVGSSTYRQAPFYKGDLLQMVKASAKAKRVKTENGWESSKTEKDNWIDEYKFIRRNPKAEGENE